MYWSMPPLPQVSSWISDSSLKAMSNKICTVYYELQGFWHKMQCGHKSFLMYLFLQKCLPRHLLYYKWKLKNTQLWYFTELLCFLWHVTLNLGHLFPKEVLLYKWFVMLGCLYLRKINLQCLCTHTFYIGA